MKMVYFTYIPQFEDPHETDVMRVHFVAGVPVEIDEDGEMGGALAFKLRNNPWFHEGDDPPAVGPSPAVKQASDLRDQARALWMQAWTLDPKGTEADVSPPQYAIDLKQRTPAAQPSEEVTSEQHS